MIYAQDTIAPAPEPIRKRLEAKKAELQKKLTDVNSALTLLSANPQLETFYDTIQKVYAL